MNRNKLSLLVLRVEGPLQAEEWPVYIQEVGLKNRRVRQTDYPEVQKGNRKIKKIQEGKKEKD